MRNSEERGREKGRQGIRVNVDMVSLATICFRFVRMKMREKKRDTEGGRMKANREDKSKEHEDKNNNMYMYM